MGGIWVYNGGMDISPEKLAEYRAGLAELEAQRLKERCARNERAWRVAREAAKLLKERYGVERVVAFGSILWPKFYFDRSDIDLAVSGLDPKRYLDALGEVMEIDPTFPVDLVEFEQTEGALRANIERDGVAL